MAEEVSSLKLQLKEREEEIAALKKRLEQLEKVRKSDKLLHLQWTLISAEK